MKSTRTWTVTANSMQIDTLVGEMTETEAGVYLYEKPRYGYFLYEKTAPEGFVKDAPTNISDQE